MMLLLCAQTLLQWALRDFSSKVTDPFTDKENHEVDLSRSSRLGNDPLRMHSLDNGMLMCLYHHKCYDIFMFSIHPDVW